MRQRLVAGLGGLAMLALASCSKPEPPRYTYVPPDTQEGRACVTQCAGSMDSCRSSEQQRFHVCEYKRQRDMRAYQKCSQASGSAFCQQPPASCPAMDLYGCEATYRSCYETCGGKVTTQEAP
jgi:hypothetical protein